SAAAQLDAPLPGGSCGASIGSFTHVVSAGTRAVQRDMLSEIGCFDQVLHHPLGCRRAADVPEAHEADPNHAPLLKRIFGEKPAVLCVATRLRTFVAWRSAM